MLLKQVLVSEKNFLKKKVNGEIAFVLINLFHVQAGQPPQKHLSFLQNLLSQNIWNKKLMTT